MPEIIKVPRNSQAAMGRVPNVYPSESLNINLQYPYSSSYDEGLRPGVNQQWNRAANQSGPEQLLEGLVSRGLSIFPKIVAGLGSVGGAFASPFTRDISDI